MELLLSEYAGLGHVTMCKSILHPLPLLQLVASSVLGTEELCGTLALQPRLASWISMLFITVIEMDGELRFIYLMYTCAVARFRLTLAYCERLTPRFHCQPTK